MSAREQIETTAAEWLARQDGGRWTDADQSRLGAWLEASVGHRMAYWRLRAAWQQANRLRALGGGVQPGVIPSRDEIDRIRHPAGGEAPHAEPPIASPSRRAWLPWAAAVILLAAGLLTLQQTMSGRNGYSTPVGGLAEVPLADGSGVTLNTDSEIRVRLDGGARRVELKRGEAFFAVAKDASRPFVVAAGAREVVAVGTRFSVLRDGEDLQVVVTEGAVRLEGAGTPVLLPAGRMARVTGRSVEVQSISAVQADELLAWRSGFLAFRATPLSQAAAQFNRYNATQIVIEDPALAAELIGGNFRATNVEAFLRLMQDDLSIVAAREGGRIVLRWPAR